MFIKDEELKSIIKEEIELLITEAYTKVHLQPLEPSQIKDRFQAIINSAGISFEDIFLIFKEAWEESQKLYGRDPLEERCQKGYKTHPTRKTKKMYGKTYRNCIKAKPKKRRRKVKAEGQVEEVYSNKQRGYMCAMSKQGADRPEGLSKAEAKEMCRGPMKEADPKKGTGKKPKGSGRRLYTDEDPSDTVSVSFKSVSAIQKTLSKKSFKSKSHKRQSQIINLIHQRARAAYRNAKDPKTKARLKRAFEYAKKRKEASKRKTVRLRKKKK
jgi:hypothetical protein